MLASALVALVVQLAAFAVARKLQPKHIFVGWGMGSAMRMVALGLYALVVAKCEPGLASAVAVEIDRADIAEIVGTLAGEDTVFVAVGDRKSQRAAMKKIMGLFG